MKLYKLKLISFFTILCFILSIFVYTPVQAKNNGTISGCVWLDSNGNGIREYGEPGIGGITIYSCFGNGNIYYDDVASSSNGNYTIYTKNIGNDNAIKVNLNELKRMGYEITTKGVDNQIVGIDGEYAITDKMKPQDNVGIGLKRLGQGQTNYDLVSIERTLSTKPSKVGDTFDVKYKITPKAIPVEQNNSEKDIILVMDTSGSMKDNSKLSIIKGVAQRFVSKFSGNTKVNISLVSFGDYAESIVPGYTNDLYRGISYLSADGSTNIGDGLRVAYNKLNNNNGHDKYIILMTDGVAEAYSSDDNGYIMGAEELTWSNIHCTKWYGNKAKPDYRIQALDYAKKVSSEKIAKSNIRTFIVGFGSGAGANNQQIADAANGVYKLALDKDAVDKVYSGIQAQIDSQVQGNINFQETFNENLEIADSSKIPAGLKIDRNKLVANFNVDYVISNDKTKYESNPIEFSVKYRIKTAGSYILGEGGKSSFAQLILSQKTDTKYLGEIRSTAEEGNQPEEALIDASRIIDSQKLKIDGTFQVKYNITPKDIVVQQVTREKDIVLVIDTSGSMDYIPSQDRVPRWNEKSRLDIIKSVAYDFIDKFSGNEKVNISVITFSNKASKIISLTNMKDGDIENIYDKISSLESNGSTNIGDGLRIAYNELNNSNEHDKYMVFMTDGVAEAYSYNNNGYIMGTETIQDKNIKYTKWYNNHTFADPDYRTESLEYAKKVASEKIAESNIKSFIVGFGSGAGSNNQQISDAANGVYLQALDENAVNDVYNEIQKKIEKSIYGDVHFEETFSDNLNIQGIPDEFKNRFQVSGNKLIGDFKNIEYVNDGTGNYKANPINATITYKVKENTQGPYVLGSGNNTSFVTILVMDKSDKKDLSEVSLEGGTTAEVNIKAGIFTGNKFEEKSQVSMVKGFSVNLAAKVDNVKNGDISVEIDNVVKISDVKIYKDTDLNNPIQGLNISPIENGFKVTLSNNGTYSNYVIVYKSTVNRNADVSSVNDTITVNNKTKTEKHNISVVDLPPLQ